MRGLVACLTAFLLVSGCENIRHSSGATLQDKPAGSLRLASFNVHYILLNKKKGRWSRGDWERRKHPMDAAFKALDADIVAFQEMESFAGSNDDSENLARSWLLGNNPDYRAAAIGDWRNFPSTQPVFFRVDRFDILDQGWFFFSDTPDILYSRTFNGSYPAFASWVHFRDREANSNFRLINVHFDYASRDNRRRSTDLVARRLTPWIEVGETVFLAGDLNARLGSPLHETLQSIGLAFVPVKGSTYHFDLGLNLFGAIDHIGHTTDVVPLGDPVVVREKFGKTWPADHYPLVADFKLEPPSK